VLVKAGYVLRCARVPLLRAAALTPHSCVWVAAYALSAGPIGYVYLAETSTVLLRAKTTSIAAAMTGCLNLVVNYCTPLMLAPTGANWGVKGVAFFYFGTGLIGLVLVYFFIP
jgi:SP family general alpha glucoside:H+ symporter-like MFS transporter